MLNINGTPRSRRISATGKLRSPPRLNIKNGQIELGRSRDAAGFLQPSHGGNDLASQILKHILNHQGNQALALNDEDLMPLNSLMPDLSGCERHTAYHSRRFEGKVKMAAQVALNSALHQAATNPATRRWRYRWTTALAPFKEQSRQHAGYLFEAQGDGEPSRSSLSRRAVSASRRSVTSVVKQRVLMNLPSSNRLLDVISTCLMDPSLARRRAGYRSSFSPQESLWRMLR